LLFLRYFLSSLSVVLSILDASFPIVLVLVLDSLDPSRQILAPLERKHEKEPHGGRKERKGNDDLQANGIAPRQS
jgi:hypothetical protein